jgi:putative PIN family toxin of toxin-antitoxin system
VKITLDSTILVRAFEDSGGLARDLLFTILDGNHTLVLSSEILAETSRVLRYPRMRERHGMSDTRIYEYVMFLQSVATMVRPDPVLIAPIRDANDIVVLQTAVGGGASGGLADAPRQSARRTRISSPLPRRHFCNQSIFWYSQIRNC